jgi:hypothetical protein
MFNKFIARGLLAAALAAAISTQVRAGVIFGDIAGNTNFSGYEVGAGGGVNNAIAQGFTMSQSATLTSVDLYLSLFTSGTGSNLGLSIYSDNAGNPGTDLYDLSTNVTGSTTGVPTLATFSGTGSFTLNAGTKYWLDLYATNPSSPTGNYVQWDGAVTNPGFAQVNPVGPGATDVGQLRSIGAGNPPSGTPSTTDLRTSFQLNGVPEPGTVTLVGSALLILGGGYLRQRGRKRNDF